MAKDLKEKAIDIKGKKYVLVADRIIYFNKNHPKGSITTKLLTDPTSDRIVIKAVISPDGVARFTGHSQATIGDGYINKTAALENAETSAVGRALAMMGIGVIDSIASVDEINKAQGTTPKNVAPKSNKFCSLCTTDALTAASGRDYCPKWKDHKEANESYELVTKEEDEFIKTLPKQ